MEEGDLPVTELATNEWPVDVRAELAAGKISPCVGSELVSETDRVRVWMLSLAPGGRIGFHRHVLDYFWTATCDGRAYSHYADGRMVEKEYAAGETCHLTFKAGEEMVHDLQNIGTDTLSFATVEFKNGANARAASRRRGVLRRFAAGPQASAPQRGASHFLWAAGLFRYPGR